MTASSTPNGTGAQQTVVKRRLPGRKQHGVQGGGREANRIAVAILEVLAGQRRPAEAAAALKGKAASAFAETGPASMEAERSASTASSASAACTPSAVSTACLESSGFLPAFFGLLALAGSSVSVGTAAGFFVSLVSSTL